MIIDLKDANDPIKWSLFPHFKILSVHAKEPTAKNCVLDPPGLTSALLSVLQARQPTSTSTKSTSTTINRTSTSTNDYSHKELLQELQIRINTKSLNHPEGTNTTHTTPLWNQLCISSNTMENDDTPFNLFETTTTATTTTAATGKSFLLQIIITNNNDTGEDEFYTFCKTAFMVHHIFRLDQSTASKETILMVLTNIMESLTFGDALVIHYVGNTTFEYIIQTSPTTGITELELCQVLSKVQQHEQNVTLIWDAVVVGLHVFSSFSNRHVSSSVILGDNHHQHETHFSWSKNISTRRSLSLLKQESITRHTQDSVVDMLINGFVMQSLQTESIPALCDMSNTNNNDKVRGSCNDEPHVNDKVTSSSGGHTNVNKVPTGVVTIQPPPPKMKKQVYLFSTKCTTLDHNTIHGEGTANIKVGCFTNAFIHVMKEDHTNGEISTLASTLLRLEKALARSCPSAHGSIIPQVTSSQPMDCHCRYPSRRNTFQGTKRALLIGISYRGSWTQELLNDNGNKNSCHHEDVESVKKYLFEMEGYLDRNCIKLMDDDKHEAPTKENILDAFGRLARLTNPDDTIFFYYSGYGGNFVGGDKYDHRCDSIYPVDVETEGVIRGDQILKLLVNAMPEGITMTCLIDYPQSGRGMLQLPFRVTARDESIQSYIRANVVVLSGSVANPDDNSRERNQTLDFLKILENDPNPSWISVVDQLNNLYVETKSQQVPHLSSSRVIDLSNKVQFSPLRAGASKRALFVVGNRPFCQENVYTLERYLFANHGYTRNNMQVVQDTTQLPLALDNLVKSTHEGDICVLGGEWGCDPKLIWELLIRKLPEDSHLICVMEEGVLAGLPYSYRPSTNVVQRLAWMSFMSGLKEEAGEGSHGSPKQRRPSIIQAI